MAGCRRGINANSTRHDKRACQMKSHHFIYKFQWAAQFRARLQNQWHLRICNGIIKFVGMFRYYNDFLCNSITILNTIFSDRIKITISESAILISNRYNKWKRERLLFQLYLPISNRATAFNMQINFVLIRFWFLIGVGTMPQIHLVFFLNIITIICICVFLLECVCGAAERRSEQSSKHDTRDVRFIRISGNGRSFYSK